MKKIQIICTNRQKQILDNVLKEFINAGGCPFGYDEIEECDEKCMKCVNENIFYKCICK